MHKVFLAFLIAAIGLFAAEGLEKDAWQVISQAISFHNEARTIALGMLGAIDDPRSRALVAKTLKELKEKDAGPIGAVAAGLTPTQCAFYLPDLAKAAQNPVVRAQPAVASILVAIGRAGTSEAAKILMEFGDRDTQMITGTAFGQLRVMGPVAIPALIRTVTNGKLAASRWTAVEILAYSKDDRALPALRAALHDADKNVRTAAAIGLSRFGIQDGMREIEAAWADSSSIYHVDALVYLASLGQPDALGKLRALVTSPDEVVRNTTVWAMAQSGSARLKEFAYGLGLDRQPVLRAMLVEKLLDPDDPHDASVLLETMASGDETSRLIAAKRLLGTKFSGRAEPIIAKALASNSQAVRQLAVTIASGQPGLQSALASQLNSSDPAVQVAALSAIAHLRLAHRFAEVAPYLESRVQSVSAAAARTLTALDPVATRRVFAEGLNSKSTYVQIQSAAMLLAIAR